MTKACRLIISVERATHITLVKEGVEEGYCDGISELITPGDTFNIELPEGKVVEFKLRAWCPRNKR